MEFIEGSKGIYKPIRVLFCTPVYEETLQTCWHIGSYKLQIALLAELLRLQQNKQLSYEVATEDMTELLVEQSKKTLRVQLWEFQVVDFDEADARPLLKMVWEVNTSLKMRDVEFEARRLLNSPETTPAQLQHPKIIREAETFARRLTERHQEASRSKLLSPREVVMEVVPKVLQNFWLPPQCSPFSMPSQQLSTMAVGLTKAVEDRVSAELSSMLLQVTFSRSIRDKVVLSIQDKVKQVYTDDVMLEKLNCFAAELLNTIAAAAAEEICELFQTQSHNEPDSTESPAPSTPMSPSDEAPAITAVQEHLTNSQTEPAATSTPTLEPDSISPPPTSITTETPACDVFTEPADQRTPGFEPTSAATSPPPFPVASPPDEAPPLNQTQPMPEPGPCLKHDDAVPTLTSFAEPASLLQEEDVCDDPNKDSVGGSGQPAHHTSSNKPHVSHGKKTKNGLFGFFNWFFCCCVLFSDQE